MRYMRCLYMPYIIISTCHLNGFWICFLTIWQVCWLFLEVWRLRKFGDWWRNVNEKKMYLKVKIDGLPIPKGRLVKGPKINQYVETVPSIFQLLYLARKVTLSKARLWITWYRTSTMYPSIRWCQTNKNRQNNLFMFMFMCFFSLSTKYGGIMWLNKQLPRYSPICPIQPIHSRYMVVQI